MDENKDVPENDRPTATALYMRTSNGARYKEATREDIVTAFLELLPPVLGIRVTRTLVEYALEKEEQR